MMRVEHEVIRALALGVEYTKVSDDKVLFSRFSEQERDSLIYGKDDSRATSVLCSKSLIIAIENSCLVKKSIKSVYVNKISAPCLVNAGWS